ncbi:glycoside hydrolase [Paenibacillus sp. FSL H8-0537]|uniref:GH12 family glycosyl hydrolase domain-containing protein n=1 Tax=Paenibacillus sp. FSL H8-0537 TaxID=2921399 RepID=UPI0031019686
MKARLNNLGKKGIILFTLIISMLIATVAYAASSSTPYAQLFWGNNKYYVFNNTWGSGTAGSGWWESIYYNNNSDMGWSWDWKNSNPNDVKAYPSIITGWQFSNNMTSGSGLPTRIWDDKNINTSVNYSLSANGNYNAAYDVWFHSTNALTGTSTPSDELMVWLNSTNAWPLGSYVETATVGGTTWKLYRGTHPSGWNVYSFVRTSNTSSSSLNLKDFINHVVYYKNWMSNSRYVTSVQFGTEIFTGNGRMHIQNYSVTVQ